MTADTPMADQRVRRQTTFFCLTSPPPSFPRKRESMANQRVRHQPTFSCLASLRSRDSKEATPILPPVGAWNDGRHPHGCQPWIPAFARMTVVGARMTVVGARMTVVGARMTVVGARMTVVGA